MKKSLVNLGVKLSKEEQKHVFGGREVFRTPCILEEFGGKCCYTVGSYVNGKWYKEKVCV
ncbi:hypothetical protein J8281_13515 [Aquimarina sp. U1-2]|uniref:hypothetical protein n=1 Tax=Aquimarina sp. U1-2 TaxID=2823141 RepID=UPI001AEC8237|nr:hypothetical protein [Aquimarina sp. U1-2]MBP2833207.1 hypothetical protein [Aquimarina sp. U1-2]